MKKYAGILIVAALVLCVGILTICFGDFIYMSGDKMVVKTIDEKRDGVGEAIEANILVNGIWFDDPTNPNAAYFQGFVDPSMPSWDLFRWLNRGIEGRSLSLDFVWESGHWVAIQKYMTSGFEVKTLTVYTNANHDVWAFEFDSWEVCAPFREDQNVRDIFEILNLMDE